MTAEGVGAYAYTGGWLNPVPTLTGDVQTDIAYVDRFLGVKVALSEPAAPPLSHEYLCILAQAAETTGLPPDRFVATHVNRNPGLLAQAFEFAKDGGAIDLTSQVQRDRGYNNAVVAQGVAWSDLLPFVTSNPTHRLGLDHKGRIEAGRDADLVLLGDDHEVAQVWSRGRAMVAEGEVVVRSDYE